MKHALILALALSATSAFAQELDFPSIEVKKDGWYIKDNDKNEFIFSKARFASQALAVKFCSDHKLPLADDVDALALGMAGAEKNKFVVEALSFKTANASGLVFWNKDPKEIQFDGDKFVADLVLMLDGGGMDAQPGNFAKHGKLFKAPVSKGLPAICGHFNMPEDMEEGRNPSSAKKSLKEKARWIIKAHTHGKN